MGGYYLHGNVHFITVEALLEAPTGAYLFSVGGVGERGCGGCLFIPEVLTGDGGVVNSIGPSCPSNAT